MTCDDPALRYPCRALVATLIAVLIAGCQSTSGKLCHPRPEMTTADLIACGCRLVSASGASIDPAPGGPGTGAARSVAIQKYACPSGKARFARVTVVNGVVREILD